jgi:hypothetical protein
MHRMAAAQSSDDTMIIRLRAGEFLPLRGVRERSVAVIRGRLWIAQDDGLREAVVKQGRRFVLNPRGDAMLHALESSSVKLIDRGTSVRRVSRKANGLASLLSRWFQW